MDINYYAVYDLSVPYRNIKIYPVTVKDYMLFGVYSQCLYLEKNTIPDAKIISMSELEYIYYASTKPEDSFPYLLWWDRLLAMCIKDDESFIDIGESIKRYKYDKKEKPFFIIDGEEYTSKDFEEIRDIIANQNLIEAPDENISKEVKDSMEAAKEYKQKISGAKPALFEDYIIALSIATGWTFDYIYSMSIRKFTKSITRMDNLIHYKIYLAASMSGMADFKDKSFIKHWLSNLDNDDKYGDVSMSMDSIQSKISMESAIK
jgi:hypothetical protein